jgi:hypothetical protein
MNNIHRRNMRMYRSIVFVVAIFTAGFAFSQQATESGKITLLMIHNAQEESSTSQRVRIGLSDSIKDDFCSTTGDWVINLNNDAAKAQYSFLLASYVAGNEVQLTGNPSENCIAGQEVIRNVSPK